MSQPPTVMRSFTRAFKIPILIGRFQGGLTLPGGPYSLVQIVTAVVVFLAAMLMRPVWGRWGVLDFVAAAVPAMTVGFVAGKVSFGARGPFAIAASLVGGMASPAFGSYRGRTVSWPARSLADARPTRTHHQVLVISDHALTGALTDDLTGTAVVKNVVAENATAAEPGAGAAAPANRQPKHTPPEHSAATAALAPSGPTAADPAASGPDEPSGRSGPSFPAEPAAQRPGRPAVTAIDRLLAAAERVS